MRDTVNRLFSGVEGVERCWHFCLRNAWGSRAEGLTKGGYGGVLAQYFDVDVDAFVLDRLPRHGRRRGAPRPAGGQGRPRWVIDVRDLEVEQPEQVAARIRAVLEVVPAERVTLTTDCGMKQLPRTVARAKLGSLTAAAAIVRAELEGTTPATPRVPI